MGGKTVIQRNLRLLVVAVAQCARGGPYDKFSLLSVATECPIGFDDPGYDPRQDLTGGPQGTDPLAGVSHGNGAAGLCETVGLENGNLRQDGHELPC